MFGADSDRGYIRNGKGFGGVRLGNPGTVFLGWKQADEHDPCQQASDSR